MSSSPYLDEVVEGLEPGGLGHHAFKPVKRVDEAGEVRPEGELVDMVRHVENPRGMVAAEELWGQ